MFSSKKKKVLKRLNDLKDDLDTMQSLPQFHGWLSESLSIANTYFKSKDLYNKLLELQKDAEGDARFIDSYILQGSLKEKAQEIIKGCIRIIRSDGVSIEKSENASFDLLESIRKYSLTGTLVVGIFWLGYNHFKNENEITIQKQNNEQLTNEINKLKELNARLSSKLDSIFEVGQSNPDNNSNNNRSSNEVKK